MSKIAEKYGPTSRSFKLFVEQTNNFGDGSVKVRYDAPTAVEIEEAKMNWRKGLNQSWESIGEPM